MTDETRPAASALPLIAIDGPAGAGKSTVAKAVAERLGVPHFDTGAMYRAVTWVVLRDGIDPHDGDAVHRATAALDISIEPGRVTVDGIDVTTAIRSPEVTANVSAVAAVPAVRDVLVSMQRRWALGAGAGVMEGRDIGTVVLPEADLKIYLTATARTRARRRLADGEWSGGVDQMVADIERRDRLDSTREVSPLRVADDAVTLWTDELDIDEVVEAIEQLVKGRTNDA